MNETQLDPNTIPEDLLPPEETEEYNRIDETPVIDSPPPTKRRKKRRIKPFIFGGIALLLVIALVIWLIKFSKTEEKGQVLTDMVQIGSITSMVDGDGIIKAKNSTAITISSAGTVQEVYVTEGQEVTAGTLLYKIDSETADEAVQKAQDDVLNYQNQLKKLREANEHLIITAPFTGKLVDVGEMKVGDTVAADQVVAKLADDTTMKLTQYYSYAYEGEVYVGQPAKISIPSVMEQISGTVTKITKVDRISPEGSKLFSVEISIPNPGSLTEKMAASAILQSETGGISPYEPGELEYTQVREIKAKTGGEITYLYLENYLTVPGGTKLIQVDGEDNADEIDQVGRNLRTAQQDLADAQESKAKLTATAPIDGTVIGLALKPGEKVEANTTVINISNTSTLLVEANIDERNIAYVTPGVSAELDQYGTIKTGTVETVSLSSKSENGLTTYPATIAVDNSDGAFKSGSSVVYHIVASQSDGCLILPIQSVKSVADPETGEGIYVVFVKSETPPDTAIEVDGTSLGVPEEGFYAVPVETGISDKTNIEILSGVEEGTEVFTQVIQEQSY